jgi:hypothetical protein
MKTKHGILGIAALLLVAMFTLAACSSPAGSSPAGSSSGTKVGDTGPAGGIIFYVQEGTTYGDWTYLEAAPTDLEGSYAWASVGLENSNISTGTALGTGETNQAAILLTDSAAPAAKACADYNHDGYTDWFLPSRDELEELSNLPGFVVPEGVSYWSSSQASIQQDAACCLTMEGILKSGVEDGKNNEYKVRPIRAY